MSDVKVSVVVPVYNVEKYLKDCLNSLINQSLREIEIICVNDGSTDSSLSILEEYDDERIKIITQENKGLSGARNTGFKKASGEYTFFLDSDDWLELNALEEMYNLSEKLDLDICLCQFVNYIHESNTYEHNDYTDITALNPSFDGTVFNYNDISDVIFKITHSAANKLYKTDFLKDLNAEFPEGLNYEDVVYFFKVFLMASRVSIVRKPFYIYRIRDNSISTTGGRKSFDIFKVLEIAYQTLKELNIYDKLKQEFLMFVIVNFKYAYIRLKEDLRDEYFKIMRREYDVLQLDQFIVTDSCHFDDRVFYEAITRANNGTEFELTYKMLYYEFLANHYQGLCKVLEEENANLKKSSVKNKFKRIFR